VGAYINQDPIGLAGGVNAYIYANMNPLNRIDSLGLDTVIIINNNTPVIGTHAGLYLDHGVIGVVPGKPMENTGREIYDPAGHYLNATRGEEGTFYGKDADLNNYINFQKEDGTNVEIYRFKTTPEEEREIAKKIQETGDPRGLSCAPSVSSVLSGTGPFKNLGTYRTPSGFGNALKKLLDTTDKQIKK
jgi:uncharacterized protein RhaS with RHS repeats